MKKIAKRGLLFVLSLILFGAIFGIIPQDYTYAEESVKQINNQVVVVTYSDGNEDWFESEVESTATNKYTQTPHELMQNAYNESVSSVNKYYSLQSYGQLDMTSHFVTNDNKAFKIPFTHAELLPYSSTNPDGYFEYDICSYSSATPPSSIYTTDFFAKTTHLFSAFDCGNSSHNGKGSNCDMDTTDGVGCLCAYYNYGGSNIACFDHYERYLREHTSLKYVLSQAQMSGDLDSDDDGYIDALTFIFEGVEETVGWNDLLWAHQWSLFNLSSLSSYSSLLPTVLKMHGVRDASRSDFSSLVDITLANYYKGDSGNQARCYKYNLYLFSHLCQTSYGQIERLVDDEGRETISSFTLTHELGHVLGLPDFYVYNDDENEDAVAYWDLMAYNYKGAPMYMTTYNREKLGYLQEENVVKITKEGTYTLNATCYDELYNNGENSGNILALVYEDPDYEGQKIYMEYRLQEGAFESYYKNHYYTSKQDGLIVYRVDEGVKQDSSHSGGTSAGNYYGYPYNMYVFRNAYSSKYAVNSENTSLANITFQSYDHSKTQKELEYDDVTFINSGLTIEFVKEENGQITFKISGGKLEEEDTRDINEIKLKGGDALTIDVGSEYSDLGIDFASFSQDEFNITISGIDTSVLGVQYYKYTLTLKTNPEKTLSLTRTITVVDRVKPTITLNGETEISLYDLSEFVDAGVTYSDNYDDFASLKLDKSDFILIDTDRYKIVYTVTDSSGNSSYVERFITLLHMSDFSSITLKGDNPTLHDVNTTYVDEGINWGIYSESDFEISVQNNVDINVLSGAGGYYTYVYTLTYNPTGETYSLIRKVSVVDRIPPVITITGDGEITLSKISGYVERGATATDNINCISINWDECVEVGENEYEVTYTATDSSGNISTAVRKIHIREDLFSSITFNGGEEVVHDVKTTYIDQGLDFETFTESDFEITYSSDVNENVIGDSYTYIYTLKYLLTLEKITLTRRVCVVDRVKPTITLNGEAEINLYPSQLNSYSDKNVEVADNYDSKSNIEIITRLEKIDDENYRYYYKAKDKSGNESDEIYRDIKIIHKAIQQNQISFEVNDKGSIQEYYEIGAMIKFKANVSYNIDNLQNVEVIFIVDNERVESGNKNYIYHQFQDEGVHKVKIIVGETTIEREINIVDGSQISQENIDKTLIIYIAIAGVVTIIAFAIIITISKKNKYKYYDNY